MTRRKRKPARRKGAMIPVTPGHGRTRILSRLHLPTKHNAAMTVRRTAARRTTIPSRFRAIPRRRRNPRQTLLRIIRKIVRKNRRRKQQESAPAVVELVEARLLGMRGTPSSLLRGSKSGSPPLRQELKLSSSNAPRNPAHWSSNPNASLGTPIKTWNEVMFW